MLLLTSMYYFIVTNVSFNQSVYNVDENIGHLQVVLALGNPSSTDITVEITDNGITANGK